MREVVEEHKDRKPDKIADIFNNRVNDMGYEEMRIKTEVPKEKKKANHVI